MIYSVLEQHRDGAWWYHPGDSFDTLEEAKERADHFCDYLDERPVKVIEHELPFPQDKSRCTFDGKHFGFAGGYPFTLEH